MKKLSEINEGTLWGNTIMRSDTDKIRKEDELHEDYVRSFLRNFSRNEKCKKVTIRKENGTQVVDIEGDFYLRTDITKIPFQFGKVTGDFNCEDCNLNTLKGCPKYVGGYFTCSHCKNLTSLDGCPEYVGDYFFCHHCGEKFTKEEVKQLCNVNGKRIFE